MPSQDKFRLSPEERWKANFEKLKQFKEQYGHANPPRRFSAPGFENLGMWMDRQRRGRRNEERLALNLPGKGTHRLSSEKAQRLTALGVQWDFGYDHGSKSGQESTLPKGKSHLDNGASDSDNENVDERNNPHSHKNDDDATEDESEPESESENDSKSEYESEDESEEDNESSDDNKSPPHSRSIEEHVTEEEQGEFEENFSKLQHQFQSNWPECRVQYLQDPDLGEWVFRMRRSQNSMPAHQVHRLNAIEFDWHGPCTVHEAARNDQSQSSSEFAFAQDTQDPGTQREVLADSTGYTMGLTPNETQTSARQGHGPRKTHRHKQWEASYQNLCRFLQTHDGLENLRKYSYKLCRWVRRQRSAFKYVQEMKQGMVPSGTERIEEYQIALLQKLGVQLNAAERRKKKKQAKKSVADEERRGQQRSSDDDNNGDERRSQSSATKTSRLGRKRKAAAVATAAAACIEDERRAARDRLEEAVEKKKMLEKELAQLDQSILQFRQDYYAL